MDTSKRHNSKLGYARRRTRGPRQLTARRRRFASRSTIAHCKQRVLSGRSKRFFQRIFPHTEQATATMSFLEARRWADLQLLEQNFARWPVELNEAPQCAQVRSTGRLFFHMLVLASLCQSRPSLERCQAGASLTAFASPLRHPCRWCRSTRCSLGVRHSRFPMSLFPGFPSIWWMTFPSGIGPCASSHTRRCRYPEPAPLRKYILSEG